MPPGRTARLWLRRRLAVASRGIDVLEQKTHALVREQRRLRHHVDDTRRDWEDASRDADLWFLRAVVIGGNQQVELVCSQLDGRANATVAWRSVMGVAYPAQVRLAVPDPGPVGSLARSSALAFASSAHQRALEAALDHAAATRALALVERELAVTQRRLKGLENRWVPRLQQTLHDVELSLAEDERDDMVRARWVADQYQGGRR
jgi:V/A-type H+-transporting ATPase subunit D